MAKFRKKGRKAAVKPSVLSMVPLGVVGYMAYTGYGRGGIGEAANAVSYGTIGVNLKDGSFDPARVIPFAGACVATYAMKKVVKMTGANRAMKGLPFRL